MVIKNFQPATLNQNVKLFPLVPRLLLLLLSGLLLGARAPQHALYLSLEEIRYQAPTLSVGFRIFSDDLEDALRQYTGQSIPVIDHWQEEESQAAIMAYLQAKTSLTLDGRTVRLTLDHIEPQQNATWIACRVMLKAPPHEVTVDNRLLLDVFDTQKNLVRIYHGQEMNLSQLDQRQTRVRLVW